MIYRTIRLSYAEQSPVPIRLRACQQYYPGKLAILVNSPITFMQFLKACNNDDGCLCSNPAVTAVTACQQCFFTTIIDDNRKMPEALAGSTPALAGRSAFSVLQGVSADFACSVCCGLSDLPCQYHRPGNGGCPYTPSELGRTYRRAFEPWGDDSLRHDWRDYWCWVSRDYLYYVTFAFSQFSLRGAVAM
jgi:hypothetical protein